MADRVGVDGRSVMTYGAVEGAQVLHVGEKTVNNGESGARLRAQWLSKRTVIGGINFVYRIDLFSCIAASLFNKLTLLYFTLLLMTVC